MNYFLNNYVSFRNHRAPLFKLQTLLSVKYNAICTYLCFQCTTDIFSGLFSFCELSCHICTVFLECTYFSIENTCPLSVRKRTKTIHLSKGRSTSKKKINKCSMIKCVACVAQWIDRYTNVSKCNRYLEKRAEQH